MTIEDVYPDGRSRARARRAGSERAERGSRPRAVVIGSGFGGLACAVRLGAKGYDVTVLERLDAPGGRARVHRQDGFCFDAGPTIITLPFLFEELWALCGRRFDEDVRLAALSPFYKLLFDDGSSFTCSGDEAEMRAEVARLSPGDLKGYERFVAESEGIYRFAFEDLGQKTFSSFWPMIEAGPNFAKHRADRSVYDFAASRVRDERLRIALSFHPLFIGGNPFSATKLYALVSFLERRYGVHFAMGGTGALVDGLVGLIEALGGRVRTGCDVDEILVEDGRACGVRLASGEVVRSSVVVSNADVRHTYAQLLRTAPAGRWSASRFAKARSSMGLFVWYFGTNRRYDAVDHHTILLGPRYKGLLRDIFDRKHLAEDFSLYLHRPTATDPSLAPPGCDAFYVLSPTPNLRGDVDWAREAEPYRRAIEAKLEATLLPGLRDAVVSSKIATPLTFQEDYFAFDGAAFSLEPVLLQSAWFRPHNRSESIKGLYLVGAGTHPGAGVPGVLTSAKLVADLIPAAVASA